MVWVGDSDGPGLLEVDVLVVVPESVGAEEALVVVVKSDTVPAALD